MIPQIIVIALVIIGLMINSYMHGKPKVGTYSVWQYIFFTAINFSLLYWGGFFNVFFN